ncbi:cysteine--1-D-myo-inosityl 2-amino-2-deoxy-alpha-D-glucopyranoside ligase [Nocardiopsis sp. NPDC006938]|uniref:cysteine--1-D-myo-inosityl 2-amino-2-deoxy-alpha-D-glucopyranoside ligase n=1 Tax=Nocardiopsis sp. NPDC006938 TaxID=3364337 RepID=UPI00368860AA
MRSWSAPDIVPLPGTGGPLRIHDTATGRIGTTTPGSTAGMYACGITPYDAAHLGHAFTYLTFDLVNRVWRDAGHDVDYVQNTTDIDDPLLERAEATGVDWRDLAHREIDVFRDDMAALAIIPPASYVGVVESVDLISELAVRIRETGAAYEVDGDLYFSVASAPEFGEISNLGRAEMLELFGQRGGDPSRAGKKDPLDWLLWRAERPGEPAWDSPLGRGRPGWHIECSAIALDRLGPSFDINGGGSDLIFPHHEMGAAETRCATGRPNAHQHLHVGMVGLNGEKMSKSLGNLVFVSKLRQQGVDPAVIRLAMLTHHYRTPWEWTDSELPAATERAERWRAATALGAGPDAAPVLAAVRAALAEDLDSPSALAAVDAWATAALTGSGGSDTSAPGLVRTTVDTLLGVRL